MRVLIIGGAGMIGHRLALRLAAAGELGGRGVSALCLSDVVTPSALEASFDVDRFQADLRDPKDRARLLGYQPDVIFNLAAVVSGQAEADFELGMAVNLEASRAFLEDIRLSGLKPIVVGTSSIAVFGGALPDEVPDHFRLIPQSSYGTQKAMLELLMGDHSRRGHFDARTVRLPTITVRPGKPNQAASSFVSGIIREPLNGEESVLPVARDTKVWIASPDCAVDTLLHMASLAPGKLSPGATVSGRGVSVSVQEMLDALERLAGPEALAFVIDAHDPRIDAIVGSWPKALACTEATALGFPVDASIDAILQAYQAQAFR